MTLGVYAVRDIKSGYNSLGTDINDGTAIRAFLGNVSVEGTLINKYRKDFDFVKVGEFDTDTGVLTPIDKIVLVNGADSYEV